MKGGSLPDPPPPRPLSDRLDVCFQFVGGRGDTGPSYASLADQAILEKACGGSINAAYEVRRRLLARSDPSSLAGLIADFVKAERLGPKAAEQFLLPRGAWPVEPS